MRLGAHLTQKCEGVSMKGEKERRLEKGGDAMRRRVRGDPWEWLFSC
jgi:hypothetical protein